MKTLMFRVMPSANIVAQLSYKLFVVALVALLLYSPLLPRVQAAAGDLDPSFGSAGKVVTSFSSGFDEARDIVIQPDGKIVAGGVGGTDPGFLSFDFSVARYNPDGSLDPSFGVGGKVVTDFDNGSTDEASAIALQPDGKIILAGETFGIFGTRFALMRYNPDGSLDASFGNGGKVATDFEVFPNLAEATALALQPDGKIIAAGVVFDVDTRFNFALARYNPDGSLDPSFGNGGKVITDFDDTNDTIRDVLIQPDDKIVAAGASDKNVRGDFGLARYNPDGSLDSTFGVGGKVVTDLDGPEEQANCIALQPDGKIVAGGSTFTEDIGLARYNPDGSLDSTFGMGGIVLTPLDDFFGSEEARDIVLQPDGKIVVAGGAVAFGPQLPDYRLLRYNANGSLDAGFGAGGIVTTDFSGNTDQAQAIALQSDGKIIVAGSASTLIGGANFGLARYIGGPVAFDLCLQDDGNRDTLRVNTTTGVYQFTSCRNSLMLDGTGTIFRRGSLVTLQHNAADRRVLAKVDTSVNKATASIQVFSLGTTFTIMDRSTINNSCACPEQSPKGKERKFR